MTKIIAIGGGEIGRPGYLVETTKIDKEIIALSGKKKPRFIFIPTASSDAESYIETVKKYFGKRLNCRVDILYLIKEKPSRKEIEKKILNSDIIYVGGGNTLKMIKIWRKYGADKILEKAYKKGVVLSGLSAGSICWFKYGNSDSKKFKDKNAPFIKVKGLGFINAINCPHYNTEKGRKKSLKEMTKKTSLVGIALDNCSALEVVDSKYRVITSKKGVNAYKVYWQKEKYCQQKIKKQNKFMPLNDLLKK